MKMPIDSPLTMLVKEFALKELRVDLIGVANVERFQGAPLMMSPQGILPPARSVISLALHHPDASIERGGMTHPQEIGPYAIQYHMNWRLDDISYKMALFIQKLGFQAVGIASSNIWRYKGFENLKEQFAPDLSHMHAAVAAGNAEFGYSGLAITPEFGARQRWVTIVTDMELTPSPLLPSGSVCDHCMLCRKHCRSGALSKELKGMNEVKIEDKVYTYANKNLWRCAWGEHFDLDLDLPIPDHVDESVIMEMTIRHGRRGGEMGSCLRYCTPKSLRYTDTDYSDAPRRRKQFIVNPATTGIEVPRGLVETLRAAAADWALDQVLIFSPEKIQALLGVNISDYLPGAKRAITILGIRRELGKTVEQNAHTHNFETAFVPLAAQGLYDITRILETFGFNSCVMPNFPDEKLAEQLQRQLLGNTIGAMTLLTDAELPETADPLHWDRESLSGNALRKRLEREYALAGGELFGITTTAILDELTPILRQYYEGEIELVARNTAPDIYKPYVPEIREVLRHIRSSEEYLKGAKSVIVLGMPLLQTNVEITAVTPAKAVGPYVFTQYETIWQLKSLAWRLCGILERAGFRASITFDYHGTGSVSMNPRGEMPDYFCNTFPAIASGLGTLTDSGAVLNKEYGMNARYIAILTDAELPANEPATSPEYPCASCSGDCFAACPSLAFGKKIQFTWLNRQLSYRKLDVNRCNWAKRYSLIGSEGSVYTGWKLDRPCPKTITKELLDQALRQLPQIEKIRPCTFEQCILACPHCRKQPQKDS